MKFDHNLRVWFLNEGAGYKNQLGYQTVKDGKKTGKGEIFNKISCTNGCQLGEGSEGVLDIGDFNDAVFVVDFGKGNLTSTAVPEPGTMAALPGVTGADMWMRRRKKQDQA